ncbi:hypothetical protein MCUN1_000939 [Malassezia cuniculi]|uniref:Amino acid transporter transmembrane domain-containing protein n=1 Tax=Malassezia cuniculi TaxID=948313 RepID=A0AAF0J538_9BASI|nr:hypothetical protein MCUN1_000939 [Malassezia cuniculi]
MARPGQIDADGVLHISDAEALQPAHILDTTIGDDDGVESEIASGTIRVWDEDSDNDDEPPPRRNVFSVAARRAVVPASTWKTFLLGSSMPGTLTTSHVGMNLFAASLHPAVLLSMPVFFARAGTWQGMLALALYAFLGAIGGGVWVILGRYVGGLTLESVTGTAFGMHTRWKRNLGRALSGIILTAYCTSAAVIAYHALADLLLHVFFHYADRGDWLHDRAFVTFVVGGCITLPLVVLPLPKRAIIQLSSIVASACYPAAILLMLWHIRYRTPDSVTKGPTFYPHSEPKIHANNSWPWATQAMLPVLTLSTAPAQVLLHNRSLRRTDVLHSKVYSFMTAQGIQVVLVLIVTFIMGVHIGIVGANVEVGGLHGNLFTSFPMDDDVMNAARLVYCALLATHVCLCVVTSRASWSRLLKLVRVLPKSSDRRISKVLRDALSGSALWALTATSAYYSGAGGVLHPSKHGSELRFLRAVEYTGIMGAIAGIILPSVIWIVLFRIRRPRAILPVRMATRMGQSMKNYLFGPLSTLIRTRRMATFDPEEQPLLQTAEEHGTAYGDDIPFMPNHLNEDSQNTRDEATLILLARKERAMQRFTRSRRRLQEAIIICIMCPLGLLLVCAGTAELLQGGN